VLCLGLCVFFNVMFIMVFSEMKDVNRVKWRLLLNDIVKTCFHVADVVLPVVSNSSPEGNIPDDVTTDCPSGLLYLIFV